MGCCGSAERTKREWRPLEDRSCTDLPWFLLFTVFCVGMGSICGFTIATGGAARLIFGYDSYGNTCGRRNERIEGVQLSGLDHTDRKFVFFLDPCNIDIVQRKIKSMALCVSLCPPEELKTHQDLKRFAMTNGSELCSYELPAHRYPALLERFSRCPKLPVPRSKPLPLFNRCTPVDVSCYARFAEAVVTFVGDSSVLHRLIAGVAASKEIIVGLCVLALALSMVLMVIIRYISAVLVWILTSLVVLGSLAGTSVLWWLYIDHRLYANDTSSKDPTEAKQEAPEGQRDGGQALLVYAAAATIFTIILLLLMLFMRKRVALTIALFHVAGKVFIHLPLLTLQPFITFLALLLFWVYWILVLLFLGTTGWSTHTHAHKCTHTSVVTTTVLLQDVVSPQVLIMTCTAFAGVLLLNYQRDYAEWLLPLIIVCLFSFLVAHCFLSIFEIVVDVLFLCFAIDTKYNDGTPGKEFFMDKALMEFVESSRRLERAGGRGRSRVKEAASEGAEMKPMVSERGAGGGVARRNSSSALGAGPHWGEGGEWEELQEFQVYCLLVGVLVDWVLAEQSDLVLCLSEDVVLFLCVCLPTSTLFLVVSLLHAPSPAPFAESASKSAVITAAC
ncbi:choline transporter-like protein 1 [Poecilia formosa]|uniref:choline transporter-like protein 1 n=1 Tax=Poecilia formosa TaxID=48698 RepID=UPI0007B8047E|nr:PREDICTED: choline transporter-like protein 1 [Poecilia formosa]